MIHIHVLIINEIKLLYFQTRFLNYGGKTILDADIDSKDINTFNLSFS